MSDATGILVFVPVLASSSRPRIPLHLEVSFVELNFLGFLGIDDSDGDSRRVNSTFAFCGRDTLDSVSARLFVEL